MSNWTRICEPAEATTTHCDRMTRPTDGPSASSYARIRSTELDDVLAAIESVQRQDAPVSEIIVVIDHNRELLERIVGAGLPNVLAVENRFARGLSGARNTGIELARGDLIVFLDDDALADPGCLRLLTAACQDPAVIGAVAQISPVWPGSTPRWFPGEFLWVVGCSYTGLRAGETCNLLGAAMCLRREVFERVGGFDDGLGRRNAKLPFGCEETELCIRAKQSFSDGRFVFEPRALALHKVSRDRVACSYLAARCYAEGISKAHLSRLVGANRSLASEGTYVTQTLPRAISRYSRDVLFHADLSGIAKIAAMMLGLACAAVGFLVGRAIGRTEKNAPLVSPPSELAEDARREHSRPSTFARMFDAVRPHLSMFTNASLLGLGTGVGSVLGFAYWWVAARAFAPEAVGYAAAALSLINFLSHVGEVGLGALLIGDIHRFQHRSGALVAGALVVSGGCSLLLGFGYLVLSDVFGMQLGGVVQGWGSAFFLAGCTLSGLTLVLDQALVGILRTELQVVRSVSFAVIKFALLCGAPILAAAAGLNEVTILGTWVLGQLASLLVLVVVGRRGLGLILDAPNVRLLRPLISDALGHHGLNLTNLAPSLLMPFIVTMILNPAINAAFYAEWTILNVMYLVPASLATVVYSVGAKDQAGVASKLRASLTSSLAVGVIVSAVCYFGSETILSLFSPVYAHIAGSSFSLLGLSVLLIAIKYHYVSIQRLRNRMRLASGLVGVGSVFELAGAIFGGEKAGLFGLSVGWLAGLGIEVALMTPVVLSALWPSVRLWAGWSPSASVRSRSAELGMAQGSPEG